MEMEFQQEKKRFTLVTNFDFIFTVLSIYYCLQSFVFHDVLFSECRQKEHQFYNKYLERRQVPFVILCVLPQRTTAVVQVRCHEVLHCTVRDNCQELYNCVWLEQINNAVLKSQQQTNTNKSVQQAQISQVSLIIRGYLYKASQMLLERSKYTN